MAVEKSIQLLSSCNFGARTFANRRLAQDFNESLSAFKSFVRECLDPVVKADSCDCYVDDIGIAAHTADDFLQNFAIVFQWIEIADFKLFMSKYTFGHDKIEI